MPTLAKSKIEKTYARFLWIFLTLAVATIFFILYFSFSKTKIFITPEVQPLTTDVTIFVDENTTTDHGTSYTLPSAKLVSVQVSGEATEENLPESGETSSKALGEATLYNTLATGQSLVQNTRLLTSDGILYRTRERVFVPAGGKVAVSIIADQEGADQVIEASRFTLPGLPPHLQTSLYAESTAPTHTQTKIVTKNDISALKAKLLDELTLQAVDELSRQAKLLYPELDLFSDATYATILEFSANAKPDETVDALRITMKIDLSTLVADQDELVAIAQTALQKTLPEHMKLLAAQPPTLELNLHDVDLSKKTATLVASATGSSIISLNHPAFNRKHVLGKDRQQIRTYFDQFHEIAGIEVFFSPFWVTKAPPLPDHIEIIVNAP